jgi:uncharacterized protein with HEPN domain
MYDSELTHEILSQILKAVERIERRFASIEEPDDFLASEAGIDKLDGICMMLIAIGENLKNLDKVTGGQLFLTHPEVDWRGAKGIRDIISHHYFDLNADIVFSVCQERLPGLGQVVKMMLNEVKFG